MDERKKKSLLEALLFVSSETVSASELKSACELAEAEVKSIMEELIHEYRERDSGVLIVESAGGWRMLTNPEHGESIKKFLGSQKAQRLSMASLETLGIIAYKQPIQKAEVDELRGVNSDGVVKTLLERRLIKVVGKKDAPGRPLLYGTTREFLEYFALKNLTELPTLKELQREEASA
ncbi:MAG: SMC-Scp complex subunit ScpB [Nitrospirae bacterium]|nr:SMC-Scp complex subunit ScpB [Nitrospirota bacterium]